jgi:hypothetical protein
MMEAAGLIARDRNGQVATPIGPENKHPPKGSQGRALAAEGPAESTITLEAMGVAELPAADPLACGRAVACQLLTK